MRAEKQGEERRDSALFDIDGVLKSYATVVAENKAPHGGTFLTREQSVSRLF